MQRELFSRRLTGMILFVPAAIAVLALAGAPTPQADAPDADQAMTLLKEGNVRFVADASHAPNTGAARMRETAEDGQNPFVTILTCADSRIPVERVFDRGVGDVFVIRVAGNVADTDEIGTIEYGVGHLHTPLVVVMGHSACGAVTAVVQGAELHGSIAALVDNIRPAVEFVRRNRPELQGQELVTAAIEANVWQGIDDLLTRSEETRTLASAGKIKIVGALYDLATGRVRFMGEHPYQERIIAAVRDAKPAPEAESDPAPVRAPAPSAPTTENVPTPKEHPAPQSPEQTPKTPDHATDDHGHKPH